ncbi:c-type cytochrome [Aestuariivirga sp.]|uniref:c-type cytochrome n=1 Tax=Aestuariivirga sp. TaxID=2650926 RepID=UPI00391A0015
MRGLLLVAVACIALLTSTGIAAQQLGLPQKEGSGASRVEGSFITLGGRLGEVRIACAQCHGVDGRGDLSGAFPRLDGQSPWYLYKSLNDYASGLRYHEVMTPVALQLDDRAMQNVALHYATRASNGETPETRGDPGLMQRGGAISAVGIPERGVAACQNCHGPEGRGMAPVYPVLAGQYAAYLSEQLRRWQRGVRKGDPMNVMRQIALQMTEEDIRAVSIYFQSVIRRDAAPQPQRLPGAMPSGSPTATDGSPE